MDPITLIEAAPGEYRLFLVAGTTDVDDVIVEVGHEPNCPSGKGLLSYWSRLSALTLFPRPGLK
jgi:hypothetical protein